MRIKDETFITDLASAVRTHDDWLILMDFCMPTLIKEQSLLAELIFDEAAKEAGRRKFGSKKPADHVAGILKQLSLKLELV